MLINIDPLSALNVLDSKSLSLFVCEATETAYVTRLKCFVLEVPD